MKLGSMSAYFSGKLETNDEIGFWVRRLSHPIDRADETEIIEPSMPNHRTYASERPAGNDDAQQIDHEWVVEFPALTRYSAETGQIPQ